MVAEDRRYPDAILEIPERSPPPLPLLRRLPDDEEEAVPFSSDGGEIGDLVYRDLAVALCGSRLLPTGEEDRNVVRIHSDMFAYERSKLLETDRGIECDVSCVEFTVSVEEDDGNEDFRGRDLGHRKISCEVFEELRRRIGLLKELRRTRATGLWEWVPLLFKEIEKKRNVV